MTIQDFIKEIVRADNLFTQMEKQEEERIKEVKDEKYLPE